MGFRFQRRVKLFGGFGLNFSKSGISWSLRESVGSIGSKGMRIRTGITGLQYVKGFKKKKGTNKKRDEESSSINLIIFVVLIGFILYFVSAKIFHIYLFIVISLLSLFVLLRVIPIMFVSKKTNGNHYGNFQSSDKNEFFQKQEVMFYDHTSKNNFSNALSVDLEIKVIITLNNLCDDIMNILNEVSNDIGILNLINNKFDNLKGSVIYDFCRVFYHLNIPIDRKSIPRDILLVSCGYFYEPRATQEILNNDENIYKELLESLKNIMYSPHPFSGDINKTPFVIPELLINHRDLFNKYKAILLEFTNLITTVDDFELSNNELKIIKLIRYL